MAKFCTECGKEIADGVAFCTECGAKVTEEPVQPVVSQPVPEATRPNAEQPIYPQQPVYVQPTPPTVQQPIPATETTYKPVGTGVYFILSILFALPIIGFIACIVIAKTAKNQSLKNYAKATLIWYILSLVLTLVLTILFFILGGSLMSYISQMIPS